MLNFSKNALKSFVAAVLVSCAVFVYSGPHLDMPSNVQAQQEQVIIEAIKVENISRDYARAHADLMKKPDEIPVSSF